MSTEDKRFLCDHIEDAGVKITDEQADLLLTYFHLLEEKNKVMNLTAVSDFEGVVKTHFADSLSIVRAVDLTKVKNVMDVGSGAGFPGIPIAIAFPKIHVTMLDSLNKRVNFINEVIGELHLENAEAVHARAEEGARQKEFRGRYDLVVSRAVSNLSTLAEYCIPYVNQNGIFVSYKSDQAADEIKAAEKAIRILGGTLEKAETFRLNDTGRTLAVIRKVRKTPDLYPRKAGMPGKNPL